MKTCGTFALVTAVTNPVFYILFTFISEPFLNNNLSRTFSRHHSLDNIDALPSDLATEAIFSGLQIEFALIARQRKSATSAYLTMPVNDLSSRNIEIILLANQCHLTEPRVR